MKSKWLLKRVLAIGFIALIAYACGSTQTAAEKEKKATMVRNAVAMSDFTFKATYAYPTGYKSIYLSPFYDVKVTSDTVTVYLPYYGRAYRAPMNPNEGGYRFTSTDFEYRFEEGRKKGSWNVEIAFHDLDRPVSFRFDVWENGTARLNVTDVNRQAISFQGDLTFKDEEL